jgi:YNFM family putative membrane transporter
MPVFAREFQISAAQSSLPVADERTDCLTMIVAGAVSEARGRKTIMVASLFASASIMLASSFVVHWNAFLALRALAGITFAGLPAISMAYLAEEVHRRRSGSRWGWRSAEWTRRHDRSVGDCISQRRVVMALRRRGDKPARSRRGIHFWKTLPPSRHFVPHRCSPRAHRSLLEQFRDAGLVALCAEGFLLMGAFSTTYNYVTYHLLDAPYSLSQSAAGLIFTVYLAGIFASAWIGARAGRVGRLRMLSLMLGLMLAGVGLTMLNPLACVVLGIATVTFGFFGAHSVASTWVGVRARRAKAQAAAIYLFFYYMGSSVAARWADFWEKARWPGVAGFVAALLISALAIAAVARPNSRRPLMSDIYALLDSLSIRFERYDHAPVFTCDEAMPPCRTTRPCRRRICSCG